jgi:hypothetical protein
MHLEAYMDPISEKIIDRRRNHRIAAGVILVLFGMATLLQRWLDIGNYIVLLLGLAMLVWARCHTAPAGSSRAVY